MKPPHVQIVDDLAEQIAEVLDELHVGLEIGGDSEPAEHLLAEPVGRGDRRCVEVGECSGEPVAAAQDELLGAFGEQLNHLIAYEQHAREHLIESVQDADQPLPDALAQLAGRHARERHEQDPLQRRAVGDVACRESRDRVRLAGPGARLENGHASWQRPGDVERGRLKLRVHCVVTSSQLSTPSHRRRARRPKREVSDICQPGPRSSACGASISSSSTLRTPPRTSWCSSSASSPSNLYREVQASPAAVAASSPRRGGARVGGRARAVHRQGLAHAPVIQLDQRLQVLERQPSAVLGLAGKRRDPRDRHGARPARAADGGSRKAAFGVSRGGGQEAHPRAQPMLGRHPRVAALQQQVAERRDGAGEQPAVGKLDVHVDRFRVRVGGNQRAGLDQDRVHGGVDLVDHRVAELTRWQRSASDLGQDRGAPFGSGEARLEQSLTDSPSLQSVELDRQAVLDLVRHVGQADSEPLAQKRADRVPDEPNQVVELDQLRIETWQWFGQKRSDPGSEDRPARALRRAWSGQSSR